MAAKQVFDGEIERIAEIFTVWREAQQPLAAMLDKVAREGRLPDDAELEGEADRLRREASERRAAETALARLVAKQAAAISIRKAQFDSRELPTRLERAIGFVSRSAMLQRQRRRWESRTPLTQLGELLRRADMLAGLVESERDLLLSRRRESENDLVTFVDHRTEIIEKLRGEDGEAMTAVEATRRTEHCVEIFQTFVNGLNTSAAACNVLLHKLGADTEDLLILYQIVFNAVRRHGDENLKPDAFPNLASQMKRFSDGMLTVHGLDRRRNLADQAFAERFPAEAAAEAAVETRQAAGMRWPPFGLKPARS
ncbi:hypothetical protein [Neorhizobium huautlense]|uniref:hypothetical protein n=1 Tax=Neorhizobium huautlense TaxID=67774 RepID=UPI000CFA1DEE|nr:hypothetical protein [Neorhizobium huautlense]